MLSSKTPPRRQDGRRFGTLISHNSVSPRKKVKAKLSHRKAQRPDYVSYSVVFSPGPIGLELDEDNHSVIRVQKFVDGGPQNPGAARKSGFVQPGDEVIAVNGKTVTSYEQALGLLQEQTTTREMTFRRPCEPLLPRVTPKTTGRIGCRTIQITPNPVLVSLRAVESEPRRITLESKDVDNLLSPARVKALRQRSPVDSSEEKRAALQKIVTTVAHVVPIRNYGSIPGRTGESALVEDNNKEFRSAFEQKYDLLQELSQAKVALHQQKELFDQQSHNAQSERQRMEEELIISRREKYVAEASLAAYRKSLQKQQAEEAETWKSAYEDICSQNEQMRRQLDGMQGAITHSKILNRGNSAAAEQVSTIIDQSKYQELEASESLLRRDVEIYQARLEASERQLLQLSEKMEDQEISHEREVLRLKDLLSSKLRAFDEEKTKFSLEVQNMRTEHEAQKRRSSEDKETIKKNLHDLITSVRDEKERAEETFRSRIQALEKELEYKASLLDEREAELGRLNDFVQKSEQTTQDLQKKLENSETEKVQQQASLNSLHRDVMNLRDLSSTNQEKYQAELNELSEKTKKQNEIIILQAEESTGITRRLRETENTLNETIKLKTESEEKLEDALEKVMHLEKELETWPSRESLIRKQEEEQFEVKLGREKTLYEASLMEARSEIAEITQKCRSLESSKSFSQQEIESLRRANEDLLEQVGELRKNLDDTETQLSDKRVELIEREGDLQDIQDALTRAQEELSSCKSSLDAAHSQYSDLTAHYSKTNEAFMSVREELNSKIVELTGQCSSLDSQKSAMENILRSIRKSASESEARCSRLRQELQREREESLSQKKISEQRLAESQENLSVFEKKNSDLLHELSTFKKELSVLTEENISLQKEMESLRRLYTDTERAFESSRAAHSAERRDLELNLQTERENSKESSEAFKLSELEVVSLRKKITDLNALCLEQKQKFETDTETMSRMQAEILLEKDRELEQLRGSASDADNLRRKLQEQEDCLASAHTDAKQLQNSIERLRCDLTQKTIWADSRDAEVKKLRTEVSDYEAKLQSKTEQLQTFQFELQKRILEISAVKRERDQLNTEKVKLLKSLREAEDDLCQLNQDLQIARMESNDLSTDSSNDDLSGLSRDELKQMCVAFQEDMKVLERRASDAVEDSTRRLNQVERLVGDIGSLSAEVEKLVEANDKLNEHLRQVKSEKSDAAGFQESFEQKVKCLEEDLEATRDELENQRRMNVSLSESLSGLRKQMQAEKQRYGLSEKEREEQLDHLTQTLAETEKFKQSSENEVTRLSTEVLALKDEIDLCLSKTRQTERALVTKSVEYEEFKKAQDSMISALNQEISKHESRSTSFSSECEVLRRRVTELEMESQSQLSQIGMLKESESSKDAILSQCYEEIEERKREYKALITDMSDVKRTSFDREMKIELLERQLAEKEVSISALSEQVNKYQGMLKKIESSVETSGNVTNQEIQEIESRCSMLEEERESLTHEISCLRGDLRKTRNELHESERLNKSLKTRQDNMKALMDSSKIDLVQARELKEAATAKAKKSEAELENKQMELDHFRTQVKLLTATISRMKADYAMLQESAVQNELKAAASVQAQAEISKLKAELRKTKAKLESASAYQMSEPSIAHDHFEAQLLQFIDEVIHEADTAFQDILRHSNIVCDSSSAKDFGSEELAALDLATNTTRQTKLEDVRDSMDSLSLIIPKAISYLNEKLELLQEWKKHRQSRTEAKTPNRKNISKKDNGSPILETLERMKAVITEDLMSPCRSESTFTNRPDADMLQNVIFSLEGQIDSLLSDLKAANDALLAKEQLFADLEDLVHHHETERDILERKLESMSSLLGEGGVQGVASMDRIDNGLSTMPHHENAQKLAIQLACKVMNGDRQLRIALAFQHWSTFTTTSRDLSMHSKAASALVHELEMTREKLAILKKHLKKSRRGREPRLDRIIEGFVVDA